MVKRRQSSLPRNVGGSEGVRLGNELLDDDDDELSELAKKIASTKLPDHAKKTATKELKV